MKKPKTIAQYCILKWLEANFCIEELAVEFKDADTAQISDKSGGNAQVVCDDGYIYLTR